MMAAQSKRKCHVGNLVHDQLMQEFVALLDEGVAAQEAMTSAPDISHAQYHVTKADRRQIRAGLPPWATPPAKLCRGCMPWFRDRYIALVQVEDAVTKAIADTGGARSLIELLLALDMGLPVQKGVGSEMGTYYGPGGVERAYTG